MANDPQAGTGAGNSGFTGAERVGINASLVGMAAQAMGIAISGLEVAAIAREYVDEDALSELACNAFSLARESVSAALMAAGPVPLPGPSARVPIEPSNQPKDD